VIRSLNAFTRGRKPDGFSLSLSLSLSLSFSRFLRTFSQRSMFLQLSQKAKAESFIERETVR